MSIIACRLIGERRSGTRDQKNVRAFKQFWRIETNDPLDGPSVVLASTVLPSMYDPYASGNDTDTDALCLNIQADEEGDSRLSWIVTCDYSSGKSLAEQTNANPLLDPPKYSFSFDQFTTPARTAINYYTGNLGRLVNSIGEPFTQPAEVDDCRGVYVVRRNEAYVDPSFILAYVNTVNASAWKGCGPRCVKLKSITTGDIQQRNNVNFYETTYEFHLNPLTWDVRPLNQATKYRRSGDAETKLTPIAAGSEPVTIYTGQGGSTKNAKVASNANLVGTTGIDQVYMRYKYYTERDYNVFPF